jgi:hypothetical protein
MRGQYDGKQVCVVSSCPCCVRVREERVCARVRARVRVRAVLHAGSMCACVHVCMCACVHVCMCACVCVRMCVCACVHAYMCARMLELCAIVR